MMPARTGVVILGDGDPADVLTCIGSLEMSSDLSIDLVVVHHGPEDHRAAQLREAVGRRGEVIATGADHGHAAGANVGISRVLDRGCELVWLLDPASVVGVDTLSELRDHLDTVRDCGIVGPRLSGDPEASTAGAAAADVDHVSGASLLVRRAVIAGVGLMPERHLLHHEVADWCRRVKAAGWRVMVNQRVCVEVS